MKIRTAVVSGIMCAATLTLAGQAAQAGAASSADTCSQAVAQTKRDLENVGAPTSATDWQAVRADAQRFLNGHPWDGPGTAALKRDIAELDRLCAP